MGISLDLLNTFLSGLSCVLYIVETYYTDPYLPDDLLHTANVLEILRALELAFCAFFLFHYVLHFLAAKKKRSYVLSWIAILDLGTILPVTLLLIDEETVAGTGSFYVFVRFVRVLRIGRLATAQRMLSYLDSEISQQIFRLGLTALILTFITAGLIHLVENIQELWPPYTRPYPYGLQFLEAFYLVVTTVTTVGYGDISPKTDLGRVIIMVLMATVVIVIPQQSNKLIAIMSLSNIFRRQRYKYSPHNSHVIVSGMVNGNGAGFLEFYTELFHPDHNSINLHAVVIADGLPSADIQALLSNPRYSFGLTYLDGSVLNPKDLRRAAAQHAKSLFVLTNKFSPNPEEDDASTILRALAVKRFVHHAVRRDIQACVQLVSPRSKKLFQSSAVHATSPRAALAQRAARNANHVVCVDEIKLNLLAKSCLCPGVSTMISNLITSSGDDVKTNVPKWLQEYCEGCGYEVYRVALAAEFEGYSFLGAAHRVYEETGSLLFALELNVGGGPRVVLNPGHFVLPSCQMYGLCGFVIAEDKKDADLVTRIFQDKAGGAGDAGAKGPSAAVVPLSIAVAGGSSPAEDVVPALPRPVAVAARPAEEGETKSPGAVPVPRAENLGDSAESAGEQGHGDAELPSRLQGNYHVLPRATPLEAAMVESLAVDKPDVRDHIVLLGGSAANLFNFILPLRSRHLKAIQPIVIMGITRPRRSEWKRIAYFPRVFFVKGSTLEVADLRRACAMQAAQVVVFAKVSSGPSNGIEALVDADAIFAYRVLRKLNERVQIVVELVTQSNVNFLCEADDDPSGAQPQQQEHYQSPPFAAGFVYNASMLDTLVCQSYYNPHIITILRQIVAGGNPDEMRSFNSEAASKIGPITDSHLFQIPVPGDFSGSTYGDLVGHLVGTRAMLPLGLRRGVGLDGVGQHGNKMPFVYTNPCADAPVFREDSIFVLSQRAPASRAQSREGSARGAAVQPERDSAVKEQHDERDEDGGARELVQSMRDEMRARMQDLSRLVEGLSSRITELEGSKHQ